MCRHLLTTYEMDLVMTTIKDQSSIDLAFALAAEKWPLQDPDVNPHVQPTCSFVAVHRAASKICYGIASEEPEIECRSS